jgi:hypothetical protein
MSTHTIKNELFQRIFAKEIQLDPKTLLKTAKDLDLTVLSTDIRPNIGFLSRFDVAYTINKTTPEQFSMLIVFFAIRQTRGMKNTDSVHTNHLRNIQLYLKKNQSLSPSQIDFWKWFNVQL